MKVKEYKANCLIDKLGIDMPNLNVYKSKGNTVYLGGLRVFKNTTGYIALSYKKGTKNRICHLDKNSNAEKFFKELLKFKE